MPSAAADNVKVDGKSGGGKNHPPQQQQQTPVTDNGLPDSTGFKQALTFMEHKIRNLEKRKSKLESYRDLQKAGKELNLDQNTAVAKYDEVTNTLDFARDMCKNFLGFSNSAEKEAKKQAKREAAQRSQVELARMREIILIQDALDQMGNDKVRADFLAGLNGAAKLLEKEMKLLDDIYPAITPKHEPGNPTAFSNEVQGAAEHLQGIVEGKQKEVFGGTYAQIKEILGKIHESGYFDQAQPAEGDAASEELLTEIPVDQTEVSESYSPEDPSGAQVFVPYNVSTGPANITSHPECQPTERAESGSAREKPSSNRAVRQTACGGFAVAAAAPHHQATGGAPLQAPSQLDGEKLTQFYRPTQAHAPKPISDIVGDTSYIFLQESEIDESGGNNTCPATVSGPTAPTSTNGIHQSSFYTGPLPISQSPQAATCPPGGVGDISGAMVAQSVGAPSAGAGVAQFDRGAILQRPTTGVVAGPVAAAQPTPVPSMGSSTNGTSGGGACPAPSTNRRATGGGASSATIQSSYYTNAATLEHERAAPNFVPANMAPLQQLNANEHGHQTATAGPPAGRSNYYNANADSADRSDRSYARNNRSNQGNSRNTLDCGFYSSGGGGAGGGGETVAASNRRGGPGASHSYYQNNSHGFPKNGTRGQQQQQQQRTGNSRSNKIQ